MARYSPAKILRYWPRLTHVQLVLSDLCNQACSFCSYRDPGYSSSQLFHVEGDYNPNRKLDYLKVLEILEDCESLGVRAITFTGGGEPTVHPRFQDCVDEAGKRFSWSLITNGVLLGRYDVSGASWIRVSLDAGSAETYAKVRSVPMWHFARALESIERLRCGVGYVVTPENWREVGKAVELVKSLGASNVRLAARFNDRGRDIYPEYSKARDACREAESLSGGGFEVHNRFGHLEDMTPDHPHCGYQRVTTYIGADENLYRCCVYAYNPYGKIGSLRGRRFRDVWGEVDWSLDARECRNCNYVRINRALNEYLEEDEHSVFV